MNNYNTVRPALVLKEYGRNIQMLVEYLRTIEDKEKRNELASILVELMKLINPGTKDAQESNQKLWDDMYIMSEFDLEIDSPYPVPEREILNKKPQRLDYKNSNIRFKHYGRNIQMMIEKIKDLEDPEEKDGAIIHVCRLMKSFQNAWNHDNVDDDTIVKNLKKMSKGDLSIDLDRVKSENLFEMTIREKRPPRPNNKKRNNGGRRRRN